VALGPRRLPNRALERGFHGLCLIAALLPIAVLGILLFDVFRTGIERLDTQFLTSFSSRRPADAGIVAGAVGSLWLVGLTGAIAVPIGVGTAVYLEEYARRGRLATLIEVNISNLAGVPSIIYGLLGLELFVRALALGRSLLAGAMTLALLVLPIVIMTSREALRSVSLHLREAGLALGATSRAIGEAAPLLVLGALTYVDFLPDGVSSPFSALPIQIFNWTSRPQAEFAVNAAAGIIVLMATLLVLNGAAIVMRSRVEKRRGR